MSCCDEKSENGNKKASKDRQKDQLARIERYLFGLLFLILSYLSQDVYFSKRADDLHQLTNKNQKELKQELTKELEGLQVEFLAMTNLRMTEFQIFSNRIRELELFLQPMGFRAPQLDPKNVLVDAQYRESLQSLRKAIAAQSREEPDISPP